MREALIIWAVPVAIGLHNLEEAVWLPRWSRTVPGRWGRKVDAGAFRFAVLVLTALAIGLGAWAHLEGSGSLGHLMLASYALGQAVNVVFPHLVATVATRSVAPGLLSGVLLVLPSAAAMLHWTLVTKGVPLSRLLVVSACFVPPVLLSIPALIWLGGRLETWRKGEG